MGLPSHHHSSTRRDRRRSHHALKATSLANCIKCKAPVLSHQACKKCGNYNGRTVVAVAVKEKKAKK